jgi:hypothetical protein
MGNDDYDDLEYEDSGDIPMRTEFNITISVFPPLPMDAELTQGLLSGLKGANTGPFTEYIGNLGFTNSDVKVTAERRDIIEES